MSLVWPVGIEKRTLQAAHHRANLWYVLIERNLGTQGNFLQVFTVEICLWCLKVEQVVFWIVMDIIFSYFRDPRDRVALQVKLVQTDQWWGISYNFGLYGPTIMGSNFRSFILGRDWTPGTSGPARTTRCQGRLLTNWCLMVFEHLYTKADYLNEVCARPTDFWQNRG